MLLKEALEQLAAGKYMHRKAWPHKEGYLKLMLGMQHVWKIVLDPSPNAGNYIFSYADLISDDWQEFTLDPEVIEAEVVL